MKRFITASPRVLLVLSTATESNRRKLAGIFQYVQLHTPWNVQLVDRTDDAQTAANIRKWRPSGMLVGRLPGATGGELDFGIPTIMMDAKLDRYAALFKKASFFTCDSQAIADTGAAYFIGQGFTRFAYVADNPSDWSVQRSRFFRDHLAARGFSCVMHIREDHGTRQSKDWSLEQDRLTRWLTALPKQTALFVSNDRYAREILELCQLANINVPSDLAVLGCDNEELLCENTNPLLSSIEPDFEACGYQSARLLEQLMFGAKRGPQLLVYGVKRIVERESSKFRPVALDSRIHSGLDFIRLNASRMIGVCDIARHMCVSRRMAELLFRNHLQHSINEEIQAARIEKLKRLLTDTSLPVTHLCGLCGYQSEAHAKALFKKMTGLTMSRYRQSTKHNPVHDFQPLGKGRVESLMAAYDGPRLPDPPHTARGDMIPARE